MKLGPGWWMLPSAAIGAAMWYGLIMGLVNLMGW